MAPELLVCVGNVGLKDVEGGDEGGVVEGQQVIEVLSPNLKQFLLKFNH